jgi:membrane protein implicated in regulation of membrane protease activity
MADWMVWLIMAGILVGAEIFTGTFYLLMVGAGFAAGGVTALLGGGKAAQFIVAAVIGVAATILLRKKRGVQFAQDAASDPNVNIDIGQTIMIAKWHEHNGRYASRAMYRGSMWDVDLMHDSEPRSGDFIIREVHGSRLLVSTYSLDSDRKET